VNVGNPDPAYPQYTRFTVGQTGPLAITATRIDESAPMSWSFDVIDAAGNVRHCSGAPPPGPTEFSVADLAVNEGSSGTTPATFFITRSGDNNKVSTVKYKTSGGSATANIDYAAASTVTQLTFNPGDVTVPVVVNVNGDTFPEKDETFNLALSAPTGGVLADAAGTATIVNDDVPAYLTVADTVVDEGDSGSTPATFTVTRSGNTTGTSTVKVKTSGGTGIAGTDYTVVSPVTLTFNPGDVTKTVTTTVIGDVTDEKNETFNLVLSGAVGATVSDTTGTATIVDNDGPVNLGPSTFLTIGDISVTEGSSGTTTATFTVRRAGDNNKASTVKYATGGGTATGAGTDYTSIPAGTLLTFNPGDSAKTVTATIAGDSFPELNETFNLTLSVPSAGTVISDAAGTATIVNDDPPAYLSVANLALSEGSAGTTPASFTITRSGNTTGTSTLNYKTAGGTATAGSDYTAVVLTPLSFGPGETTKTIAIDVVGDATVEPNETFNLLLSSSAGATISDASGTATVVNDD
jgi:hypothetical protein